MFSIFLLVISLTVSSVITSEHVDIKIEPKNESNVSINDLAYKLMDVTHGFTTYGCDCGPHSFDCAYEDGQLKCDCDEGYAQTNLTSRGKCESCTCVGDPWAECKFMMGARVCVCKHGIKFGLCKPPPTCDCGENGRCSMENGIKYCDCDIGFREIFGVCQGCTCVGDPWAECKFMMGTRVCVCKHGIKFGLCKPPPTCDCGENGRCRFEKYCDCDYGFKEIFGVCQECDCGDGRCEFEDGMRKCFCDHGLKEVNGKCQECDCGEGSISCKIDGLYKVKRCTCKAGYAVSNLISSYFDDSCKECDCGQNGVSCSFSYSFLEKQTCECQYGDYIKTLSEGKKCKDCDCGFYSTSCRFSSEGELRCECKEGYEADSYYYGGDEYCRNSFKETKGGGGGGVSGWRIGTYILAVIMSIIIISLLIAIVHKNMQPISLYDSMDRHITRRRIMSFLSCFAGGVFLGTCLLHLFPDVDEQVDNIMMSLNLKPSFPVSEMLLGFGFLMILIVEQIILSFKTRSSSEEESLLRNRSPVTRNLMVNGDFEDSVDSASYVSTTYGAIEGNNQLDEYNITFPPEQPHSVFRSLLLLLALSLHSVFEGLAIGLQSSVKDDLRILLAVLIHKCIIAFSLGLNLTHSQMSLFNVFKSNIVFSLASPVGIMIGVIVMNYVTGVAMLVTSGVLQGLAAGTFLYVTLFEVLMKEFGSDRDPDRLMKVLSVVLGYSLVTVLVLFLPD